MALQSGGERNVDAAITVKDPISVLPDQRLVALFNLFQEDHNSRNIFTMTAQKIFQTPNSITKELQKDNQSCMMFLAGTISTSLLGDLPPISDLPWESDPSLFEGSWIGKRSDPTLQDDDAPVPREPDEEPPSEEDHRHVVLDEPSARDILRKNKKRKHDPTAPNAEEYVVLPATNDVLFGRGGMSNNNKGNKLYRKEVEKLRPWYQRSCTTENVKFKLSLAVVDYVRSTLKGRFLKKDKKGSWYIVPNNVARLKVSQALREKENKPLKK